MILQALEAKNFRRFRRLSLDNLPERGVIALIGDNESGKSTVGEAVCFALFGRTETLGAERATELVRWDAVEMTVQLDFVSRGVRYRLLRRVDIEGDQECQLVSHGEDVSTSVGFADVQQAVRRALGFDYEQFRDSIYLTQDGADGYEGHPETIQQMVGLDDLEAVRTEIAGELVQHEEEESRRRSRLEELHSAAEGLRADPEEAERLAADRERLREKLGHLESETRTRADRQKRLEELRDQMQTADKELREATPERAADELAAALTGLGPALEGLRSSAEEAGVPAQQRDAIVDRAGALRGVADRLLELRGDVARYREEIEARLGAAEREGSVRQREQEVEERVRTMRGRRRRGAAFGWLALLVSLPVLGAGALLRWAPAAAFAAKLEERLPAGLAADPMPLVAGGGAVFALAVVLLIVASARGRKVATAQGELDEVRAERERLEQDLGRIDELEGAPAGEWLEQAAQLDPSGVGGKARAFLDDDGARLHGERLSGELGELRSLVAQVLEQVRGKHGEAGRSLAEREREYEQAREQLAAADAREEELRHRLQERAGLDGAAAEEQRQLDALLEEIENKRVAVEILHETVRRMKRRALLALKNFVSRTLPVLTEGYYQHFRVDEDDLTVRVFSPEKQNFMSLEELSKGTYSQLMLGMRLALAEALVSTCGASPQFLFLDEPFAHWDRHRVKGLLESLQAISPLLTQYLIATQAHVPRVGFSVEVGLSRDVPELEFDFATAGEGGAEQRPEVGPGAELVQEPPAAPSDATEPGREGTEGEG